MTHQVSHRRTGKKVRASRGKGNVAGLRLVEALRVLARPAGATHAELIAELDASRQTVTRYFRILRDEGHEIEVIGERDGKKVRRIVGEKRTHATAFTLEEVVFLKLLELTSIAFRGTGIDEVMASVFSKVEATLRPKDRAKIQDLGRKILCIPELFHDYSGKSDIVDEIVSALLHEQPLTIHHPGKKNEPRTFRAEPLSLVIYKRALYLLANSGHHNAPRTFRIDGIARAVRQKDASFAYPKEWDPMKLFEGAFGMITGEETEVTLRFDASVEHALKTRIFHPTQKMKTKGRYIFLTVRPRGTTELLTWVLGWGDKVAVISPPSLRNEWCRHADAMSRMAREIAEAEAKRLALADDDDESPP